MAGTGSGGRADLLRGRGPYWPSTGTVAIYAALSLVVVLTSLMTLPDAFEIAGFVLALAGVAITEARQAPSPERPVVHAVVTYGPMVVLLVLAVVLSTLPWRLDGTADGRMAGGPTGPPVQPPTPPPGPGTSTTQPPTTQPPTPPASPPPGPEVLGAVLVRSSDLQRLGAAGLFEQEGGGSFTLKGLDPASTVLCENVTIASEDRRDNLVQTYESGPLGIQEGIGTQATSFTEDGAVEYLADVERAAPLCDPVRTQRVAFEGADEALHLRRAGGCEPGVVLGSGTPPEDRYYLRSGQVLLTVVMMTCDGRQASHAAELARITLQRLVAASGRE